MGYSLQLRSPADTYGAVTSAAMFKLTCPIYILFIKALVGGWFVGLGGHAGLVLGSAFYPTADGESTGASKLAFGLVFSGALVAIIFTGCDLFTGNTMAMSMCLYERKVSFLTYLSRMAVSLIGNYSGAVISAVLLTGGTGYFTPGLGPGSRYLTDIAKFKTSLGFGRVVASAIGCNCYVCLAVWCTYVCCDSAGSLIAQMLLISSFAVAGYEHIIANFYTLHAAWISKVDLTFFDVYITNLLPTFLGNLIAGCIVMGLSLFVLYHDRPLKTDSLEVV